MTSDEANQVASEAGRLIQRLASAFPKKMPKGINRIRFPRGYIKTCDSYRARIPFVTDRTLRDNMADTMQTHDVFRWVFDQTDISGPVRLMLIKEAIFIVASLCEAIILEEIRPLGKGGKFKPSTQALVNKGTISLALKSDLDRIWDVRNKAHLDRKSRFTHTDIKEEDWTFSVETFRSLCKCLMSTNEV